MPIIDLKNSYRTSCKLCGVVKKSLVPGNFVCRKCEVFCEQQLSGEEFLTRHTVLCKMFKDIKISLYSESEETFLRILAAKLSSHIIISNQQYLSVCRILKKES
jgi:hypothetical protein